VAVKLISVSGSVFTPKNTSGAATVISDKERLLLTNTNDGFVFLTLSVTFTARCVVLLSSFAPVFPARIRQQVMRQAKFLNRVGFIQLLNYKSEFKENTGIPDLKVLDDKIQ
jgi:hypothetical protein